MNVEHKNRTVRVQLSITEIQTRCFEYLQKRTRGINIMIVMIILSTVCLFTVIIQGIVLKNLWFDYKQMVGLCKTLQMIIKKGDDEESDVF